MKSILLLVLIILLRFILPIILRILNISSVKGKTEERKIARILSRLSDEYKVLNNIMIPKKDGGSTQIDHLVVSPYGLFVIETKNYQGWIFGNERSEKWTESIYGKKYEFFNPLRQNYGHIKALEEILKMPFEAFISVVVFSNRAQFKTPIEGKWNQQVVNVRDLIDIIRAYDTQCISYDDVDYILEKLEHEIMLNRKNSEHVADLRKAEAAREEKILNGICPKCGGKLVTRNGKYGSFLGCSNYPKCRYTKQL